MSKHGKNQGNEPASAPSTPPSPQANDALASAETPKESPTAATVTEIAPEVPSAAELDKLAAERAELDKQAEANRLEAEQLKKDREIFDAQRAAIQQQDEMRARAEQEEADRIERERVVAEHEKALRASEPHVFEVSIPDCLIGVKRIVATNAEHAYELYKQSGGILSHVRPQIVVELPADSPAYVAAVKDWRYARAQEEKQAAENAKK